MPSARSDSGEGVVAPAVLGAEDAAVFVPSQPMTTEEHEAQLELRRTTEEALALVTYTSLAQLVEGCGNQQAWISVPESEVRELAEVFPLERTLDYAAVRVSLANSSSCSSGVR